MPYTQASINITDPLDAEAVSLGAQRIRNLAAAVRERLATLVVNVDTNPLSLISGVGIVAPTFSGTAVGSLTGLTLISPAISNAVISSTTINGNTAIGGATFLGDLYLSTGGVLAFGALYGSALRALSGTVRSGPRNAITAGGAYSLDLSVSNVHRILLNANITLTLINGQADTDYRVEILQAAVGGYTVTWANALGPAGVVPTQTATGNRKDVYSVSYDTTNYLLNSWKQNYASIG